MSQYFDVFQPRQGLTGRTSPGDNRPQKGPTTELGSGILHPPVYMLMLLYFMLFVLRFLDFLFRFFNFVQKWYSTSEFYGVSHDKTEPTRVRFFKWIP